MQHYGFRYDYDRRTAGRAEPAAPLPPWAQDAAARLEDLFGGTRPEQCIVNEYLPGQGIGMHADADAFGPVVVSISLGADWPMRFRPRYGQPYDRNGLAGDAVVTLPARSALVLSGAARTRWMHGIDRRDTARVATSRRRTGRRTPPPRVGHVPHAGVEPPRRRSRAPLPYRRKDLP